MGSHDGIPRWDPTWKRYSREEGRSCTSRVSTSLMYCRASCVRGSYEYSGILWWDPKSNPMSIALGILRASRRGGLLAHVLVELRGKREGRLEHLRARAFKGALEEL